jgi:hypothetical protein
MAEQTGDNGDSCNSAAHQMFARVPASEICWKMVQVLSLGDSSEVVPMILCMPPISAACLLSQADGWGRQIHVH